MHKAWTICFGVMCVSFVGSCTRAVQQQGTGTTTGLELCFLASVAITVASLRNLTFCCTPPLAWSLAALAQVNGQTLDHNSYLVPKGTADIFFPTNFQLLQQLHQLANRQQGEAQGQVMKTRTFMEQYADVQATCTTSGYNPLLHDFTNTSFYLGRAGCFLSR